MKRYSLFLKVQGCTVKKVDRHLLNNEQCYDGDKAGGHVRDPEGQGFLDLVKLVR